VVLAGSIVKPLSNVRLLNETSSSMPTVKLFRPANRLSPSRLASSSSAAYTIAGVKSFEDNP